MTTSSTPSGTKMDTKSKDRARVGLAALTLAAVIGGAAFGVTVTTPNVSVAQDETTQTETAPVPGVDDDNVRGGFRGEQSVAEENRAGRGPADRGGFAAGLSDEEREERHAAFQAEASERMREALNGLVETGTINADQADAVVSVLIEQLPAGPGGAGRPGHGPGGFGPGFDTAAEVIGIATEDVQAAVRDGQTLAELAEANGVDPQDVIDAMVNDCPIFEDLELSDEEKEARLTEVTERITDMVNNGRPEGRGPR